jgi:NAD(P)-dependent dehydrogenase (short-subunit alcohol dehydrogenase family)
MPRYAGFDLAGRVVVVTGGGGGLGSAMARGIAGAGGAVAVADADLARAERVASELVASGARAVAVGVDVTDRASVTAMVETVTGRLGAVDGLVNSHGVTRRGAAADYKLEDWERILAVNLTGTFLCCQAVGTAMLARGRGRIVNITSIAGHIGYPGAVAYAASKGGVVMLTKVLAVEWAPRGVHVNAIAPSWFETSWASLADQEPGYRDRVMARIPVRRFGQPDELAGAAVFLLSDAASMVTGHILAVDGGVLAS